LRTILDTASPLPEAQFVWSDGLDFGRFGGVESDRYQKDLPLEKALSSEVMLAYSLDGEPLTRKRGGPVRLVVPGWFGTNSTKWLCRLSVQSDRSKGHYTTTFYNEKNPNDPKGAMRPVWMVEPNSMIVSPCPDALLQGPQIEVVGWAWSCDGIKSVLIITDDESVAGADLEPRIDFSWQSFKAILPLSSGLHRITARAISANGLEQPLTGRRNHVHSVSVVVR